MMTTSAKRSAAAGFALPGFVTTPFPDGANDQTSRWHGAFCYFLGSDEPPVPTVPTDGWTLVSRGSVFEIQPGVSVFETPSRGTVFHTQANDVIFDSGRIRVWRMKRR